MIDPDVFELGFEAYLARVARLTDDVLIPAESEMVEAGRSPSGWWRRSPAAGCSVCRYRGGSAGSSGP